MSDPMLSVTTGMEVWLVISGTRFDLTGVEVTFISQGVSSLMAHIAVGYQASLNGGVAGAAIRYLVGTPAQVYANFSQNVIDPDSGTILLKQGQQLLFDGLYSDAGPGTLAQGTFTLWVSLVSTYEQLNTGSLQFSNLLSNTLVDSTVSPDPLGNGVTIGSFQDQDIIDDFLGAFKKVFLAIATSAVPTTLRQSLQQFIKVFGASINTPAIPIINAIAGSLHGPVTSNSIMANSIKSYLNGLFGSDMRYQSFFQRLIQMGQEFKFRAMEHPLGLAVVPYSPFFSKAAITIQPSTVQSMAWASQARNNTLGTVFTYSGVAVLANGQPDTNLIGAFKRTAFASPLGVVTPLPCPYWMVQRSPLSGDSTTQIALPAASVRALIGDAYARETTYEYAYMSRVMQVVCPLRMDVGLLSSVEILYPQLPGTDLGTAIYGSVQAVKLIIDASAKRAATVLEVGYVRSQFQQEQEFGSYQHPFWEDVYTGARLDEVPLGS